MNTLKAEKRDMATKAKKLRREGYVTGVVFGKKLPESIPVKIAVKDAEQFLKKGGKGTQLMLDVDGESMDVLLKEVDYNSMKHQIMEMDFQALVSDEKVHSVAEIVLHNHEMVISGVLQQQMEEISYRAYPADLVEKVEIDVSTLKVGDSIKVKDLDIAKNDKIDLLTDPESTIVTVTEVHNSVPEEETTEETSEEA
ncbi:MAG TPA: 50S ribosomal protein L25 [Candidatus Scybalocola faecavium]|nr:50S ribosomal protein L25 [Candidatus Scybalocola faecavium]